RVVRRGDERHADPAARALVAPAAIPEEPPGTGRPPPHRAARGSGTVVARRAALGAGPRSRDAAPGPPWGADQGSRPLRGWARRLRRRVRGVASARGFGPRAPRLLRGRARGGTVRAPGSRRQAPRPAFGRSRGFGERARG